MTWLSEIDPDTQETAQKETKETATGRGRSRTEIQKETVHKRHTYQEKGLTGRQIGLQQPTTGRGSSRRIDHTENPRRPAPQQVGV